MNRPIVATNQRTNTGQRCRALQSATRTVHGMPAELSGPLAGACSGTGWVGGVAVTSDCWSASRGWESVMGLRLVDARAPQGPRDARVAGTAVPGRRVD